MQYFNQPEIGQIAIECRRRPLAGFLNRMNRKLERNAARVADAVAHAFCKLDMVSIARREIGACLRDSNDRLARL